MHHAMSDLDRDFRADFEACSYPAAQFGHVEHVRLAYTYLVDGPPSLAIHRMRSSLLSFLASLGVGDGKYHETLTAGWVYAVRHFMEVGPACSSSEEFVEKNSRTQDSRLLLAHYSEDLLFSDQARTAYVDPDILPFPEHAL